MVTRIRFLLAVSAAVLASAAGFADDLKGAERILCTPVQATVCYVDGECEIGPPWNWGVPQFIEVDFKAKKLSTTKASHERRETSFKNHERSDGLIFLQGVERGRAFSFVIEEETGMLSAAIARDQITVSVFGACTPAP
jgi:hypothetical protein